MASSSLPAISQALLLLCLILFAGSAVAEEKNLAVRTHFAKLSKRVGAGGGGGASKAAESTVCLTRGKCFLKTLYCPKECPGRKPGDPRSKACYVNCIKCEASCQRRVPGCNGYGSVCYDPRFVGADGRLFYFHGAAGDSFALVSDARLQVNARMIGVRPAGRTRDFTWVQALAIMHSGHVLTVAAAHTEAWDEEVDRLEISFDGVPVVLPGDPAATWVSPDRSSDNLLYSDDVSTGDFVVERLAAVNAVAVRVGDAAVVTASAVPVTEADGASHGYGVPRPNDCFAHLDLRFELLAVTDKVDGVLGQTYRKGYVSRVKEGVPMPVMGGERLYRTSSLLAHDCLACTVFNKINNNSNTNSNSSSSTGYASSQESILRLPVSECTGGAQGGLLCRR